ncbi:MAG: type IV pilus assembly protein PilM [Candidatus Doudnabacteria bacterium]|nr:type IV pilus assembly protein PilM [Candidatus Doudnabacteria bacterium]
MFSLYNDSKTKAFGLDVSDSDIKVMELGVHGSNLFPIAWSQVPILPGVIANHMIVNEKKLAENIKSAIEAASHIGTVYVVASIPESKSFVRVLKMPKIPMAELDGAIPFEIEQSIPVPLELVYMDWQLLRETPEGMEVLVTATPKDYVNSYASTLKEAGLIPVAFELESQAMARSLVAQDDQSTALIADISSLQTSFIIVEEGNVQYTSSIPIAGNSLTESISRNLKISPVEAETIKRERGLVADIKKGNIRQAILPLLDNIVNEIKNVARFHEEHSPKHTSIAKIILSGGSAKLPGIADYIAARMSLSSQKSSGEVILGNPWINIADISKVKLPLSQIDALSYCTVAGLALRGATS